MEVYSTTRVHWGGGKIVYDRFRLTVKSESRHTECLESYLSV